MLGWTLLASGTCIAQELIIASKNRAIEGHKLAYFELLSEVSEYHNQFARITQHLESNHACLLSMLESGAEAEAALAAIEQRLKDSEPEEGRVAVAGGGLRATQQGFARDLPALVVPKPDPRTHGDRLQTGISH